MFREYEEFDSEEYLSKASGFELAILRNTINNFKRNDDNFSKSKYYDDGNMDIEIIHTENDGFSPQTQISIESSPEMEYINNPNKISNFKDVEDIVIVEKVPIFNFEKSQNINISRDFMKIKKSVPIKQSNVNKTNNSGNKKLNKAISNWLDNIDTNTEKKIMEKKIPDKKIQSKIICGDDGRMVFTKSSALDNINNKNNKNKDPIKKIDEDVLENILKYVASNAIIEIGFCVIYSEGLCQLNEGLTSLSDTRTPKILLIYIKSNDGYKYYFMNINKNQYPETDFKRKLIQTLMQCNARKICYKSQDLILLLIQKFRFNRRDVCLKWIIIDPEIGCFMLNPDNPPLTFAEILSQFDISPPIEESNVRILDMAASFVPMLSECCSKMYDRLNAFNIWSVFINMEAKITPILALMEYRGMCIDTKALNEMSSILEEKLISIEHDAVKILGKSVQLNSPKQLRVVLFDDLKLDVVNNVRIKETSATAQKSTSESVLRQLIPFHPLPGLILNYRHVSKAKATYVDAILQQSNSGIITSTWDQIATSTGRISSCDPNLQAIPKHAFTLNLNPNSNDPEIVVPPLILRNAFVARPGHWLVAADFQHIECRVFAHMTNDETLINVIRQDVDIFKSLAKKWLNKLHIDDVTSEDRDRTKRIIYSLMYGAGVKKLSEILNLDEDDASRIVAKFSDTFPALHAFKINVIKKCRDDDGVLRSISGRMRMFPDINSLNCKLRSHAERQAVNFVIQGSAADLCKTAMIATEYRLSNLSDELMKYHLVLQIHDELVWEVADDCVSKFKFIVREVMQSSGEFCGNLSVPLPVVITQGKSWGEMF